MEVVSPFAAKAASMETVWSQISVSVTLALSGLAVTSLVNVMDTRNVRAHIVETNVWTVKITLWVNNASFASKSTHCHRSVGF